jgi:hypothetical protein
MKDKVRGTWTPALRTVMMRRAWTPLLITLMMRIVKTNGDDVTTAVVISTIIIKRIISSYKLYNKSRIATKTFTTDFKILQVSFGLIRQGTDDKFFVSLEDVELNRNLEA